MPFSLSLFLSHKSINLFPLLEIQGGGGKGDLQQETNNNSNNNVCTKVPKVMSVARAEFQLNQFQSPKWKHIVDFFLVSIVSKSIQICWSIFGLTVWFVAYIYMMLRFCFSSFLCSKQGKVECL